ncbi:BZ3500_MvSof-1268-A1-R1_Chr4-2g07144 [Microbotryum saponariae]|uniref:BZ3500_MvSof-1268-A1-R1_Chr4-2g07144 protein n=1 Tax=Microbotryum saponariae TaxID=289078 RepID=A0A2X0MX47_9BASI|nr:BZ3500_MvSof-1268-A1-R1_Chr4-2g07144 [Microbotryum saponariae]SDA06809.1 BZ3501_MvSof-1269-A2-R1_Chr4-2g06855 [Microbotryum saponariae]
MSLYPELKDIRVELRDHGVAVVYLDRPAARNAFTDPMAKSLVVAFDRLDSDDKVKVVILAGSPNEGKAFCAGADLSKGDFSTSDRYSQNSARNLNEHRDGGGTVSLALFRVRKPTIAAVNGHAVGIGITMTLGADIRFVSETAKIGFVFAQRGIVPEAASSYFLPKLIGHSRAMQLFMTAKVISATSPILDLLWASRHPSPEATFQAALDLAKDISLSNSMISSSLIKGLVWRGMDSPEDQHLLDSKAMHVAGNSIDSKEGVQAFRDKRAPRMVASVPKDLPTEFYPWWSQKIITRAGAKL